MAKRFLLLNTLLTRGVAITVLLVHYRTTCVYSITNNVFSTVCNVLRTQLMSAYQVSLNYYVRVLSTACAVLLVHQ